jgi:hypothetical protein
VTTGAGGGCGDAAGEALVERCFFRVWLRWTLIMATEGGGCLVR